jgi:sialate O-acetylesterase
LRLITVAATLTLSLSAAAQVTLPKFMTDHMVLQRGVPIQLWGWAAPGEKVKVALEADSADATADALGRWSVQLPARAAGGPYSVRVSGTNTIELNDILIGDLWFASGQSNMEIPLKGFPNSAVIKDAEQQIRLLRIRKATSEYPVDDLKEKAAWKVCSPSTADDFSAVAYFFGREIHEREKVPIGLIDSTWGGTPAEAWTSLDALSHSPALAPVMQARALDMDAEAAILLQAGLDAQAVAAGKKVPKRTGDTVVPFEPTALYNAMIAPFIRLPIRGVIWYQGESNAMNSRAFAYGAVFETLIEDWRSKWKRPELPFLYVQIASYSSGNGWAVVRDEQRRALHLKDTGMAVAIDVGEEHQVHPAQKQVVGHRLALQALAISYGQKLVHDGPLFQQAIPDGHEMKVTFDSAAGLHAKDGALGGFEVAGSDGVFVAATARIAGETVVVRSEKVSNPVYVRYAWAGFPKVANLYNGADLPASPFTSQTPEALH